MMPSGTALQANLTFPPHLQQLVKNGLHVIAHVPGLKGEGRGVEANEDSRARGDVTCAAPC